MSLLDTPTLKEWEPDLLIFGPSIHCIATPTLSARKIDDWAGDCFMEYEIQEEGTPLNAIFDAAYKQGDEKDKADADTLVEFAGRQCYRSFDKGREHADYIRNILQHGHGSVLEHANFTFAVAGVSRSLSLELIRHRAGTAISQESQRYVDANDVRFVVPPLLCRQYQENKAEREVYQEICKTYIDLYKAMQMDLERTAERHGWAGHTKTKRINEAARSVLPNSAETRFVWTVNARALRHIIALRGSEGADLEIRRFAAALLDAARPHAPQIFADFVIHEQEDGIPPIITYKYQKV